MNRLQLLLLKLNEECTEIAKVCSKAMQFGLLNIDPETQKSNKTLLIEELNDFNGIVKLLNDNYGLGYEPNECAMSNKAVKIEKYRELSIKLGFCS